jgi:hypothetical protein
MENTPVTLLVSRSAKNSQNCPKGNGGEDERLREIGVEWIYTLMGG